MKRLSVLLSILVAILFVSSLVISCPTPKPEKPVVLRFAESISPEKMPIIVEPMVERFNQRAGGKYVIELHFFAELVSLPEMVNAVETGAIEMAGFPLPLFAGLDTRFGVSEVPFLFNNIRASHDSLEAFLPIYSGILEKNFNQKVLALSCVAAIDPVSAEIPIKELEDWDGLLVQSISPPTAAVIEALGGAPVPIPFAEAYMSMQKGVVDATIQSSVDFVLPYKLYEVAHYITLCNLMLPHTAMTINLDTWNSLPKDIQDILVEEFLRLGEEKSQDSIKNADEVERLLTERGMEVYRLPEVERDRWREVLHPYIEQSIADLGELGQKAVQAAEEANSKFPY
ncbi:C4-dicarboxylate-binding periplasmic protein DctP [subsurface metagenome]